MKTAKESSTREQLVQAIAELTERLDMEKAKDKMRERVRVMLAGSGLTRRDVAAIAAEAIPKRGAAPLVKRAGNTGNPGKPQPHMMAPAKGKVGKAIRAARLKANLSGSALADEIGVAHGLVSQWERGKYQPTAKSRAKLAKVLDIAPGALVNGDARP